MGLFDSNSISKKAVRSMGLRLLFVVLIASVVTYYRNYSIIKDRTLSELHQYVEERVEREQDYFDLVRGNLNHLARTFTQKLETDKSDVDQKFALAFEKLPNGTYRNRDFNNPRDTQMFLRRGVVLDRELKKTILFSHELLNQFGNAWNSKFINIWLYGAEDYGLSFTPSVPHSLHFLPPEFLLKDFESVSIGLPAHNPQGQEAWTGPFFDETIRDWIISVNKPVYHKGKYLLSFGMDLNLTEIRARAMSNAMKGSYNIIFRDDGRLISHPELLEEIKANKGHYFVQQSNNKELRSIFENVKQGQGKVIYNSDDKLFLAARKIEGLNWWFVIVYPESNLLAYSRHSAIDVAIIGLISLLIELLILFLVIRKSVNNPIQKLIKATQKMTEGDLNARVEINTKDEIGVLGKSFNDMAEKVSEEVASRTRELDLQRALSFNASKMATLGEMSGRVAHEINNPLTVISLSAEAILKKDPDLKIAGHAEKIRATSERINKIVRGMLSYSRNGSSEPLRTVPLHQIVQSALTLCEQTIKTLDVKLYVSDIPDYSVNCREVEIVQTLLNLIQNAIDALENSGDKDIYLNLIVHENVVKIQVEDSGPGISEENFEKIMAPFFTTKEIGKGTGLGLFISSGLIKSNGGKLYVDRSRSRTCFVIELPLSRELVAPE